MFEEKKVKGSVITYKDVRYSARELQWMHGHTVKVLQSAMYPQTLAVFKAEGLALICLAKPVDPQPMPTTMHTDVLEAIETLMLQERAQDGPVALRSYALDEWIGKVNEELANAERHISYGNKHHAMDSLLKVAKECVECLDHHIDKAAEQALPEFAEVFAQAVDKKAADPDATESAA